MTNETLKFNETYRIQNLSNYIGIHIRKGDKLKVEARDIPSNKYVTVIERILETYLFICELQMLVDSHYVLCVMSSNVCRLVQILRYQYLSPAI